MKAKPLSPDAVLRPFSLHSTMQNPEFSQYSSRSLCFYSYLFPAAGAADPPATRGSDPPDTRPGKETSGGERFRQSACCGFSSRLCSLGAYPYPLKRRILSERGHLSNREAALLCRILAPRTEIPAAPSGTARHYYTLRLPPLSRKGRSSDKFYPKRTKS